MGTALQVRLRSNRDAGYGLKGCSVAAFCRSFRLQLQLLINVGSNMRTFCFLLGLIACLDTAVADEFRCNYSGNQQELNACALRDFRKADQVLNNEYKKLLGKLGPKQQAALRNEQRAWLRGRDPQCSEAVKDSEGGSIWPMEFNGCLRDATVTRTMEIKQWPSGN